MKAFVEHPQIGKVAVDFSRPLDISIPLCSNSPSPRAWHAPAFKAWPHQDGDFTGAVSAGSPVNFFNLQINPHGNGTHTECIGHITDRPFTINQCLRRFWFIASVISIRPEEQKNGDFLIKKSQIPENISPEHLEAIIVRTLPNTAEKKQHDYSGTNPPYFEKSFIEWVAAHDIQHLLTDLPSVDREQDEGKLSGHKIFWGYPNLIREDATITELIYVPNSVPDGLYLLNLQIMSLEMDVSPSKPVLYSLEY